MPANLKIQVLSAAKELFLTHGFASVGAAYGWMWNSTYEQKIVGQVMALLQPVIGWMSEAGIDQIESRCYGIWSVYYVGFRNAVIHGCNADDCITKVRPSMEILLGH